MQIEIVSLEEFKNPAGTVVVIDVLRAFTTAAFAIAGSAERIILVKEVEEAFALKRNNPHYLLMGEVGGNEIEGFDYGNSPTAIAGADVAGRTLVHRTTAGTRGAAEARGAEHLLCASFVNARATAAFIRRCCGSKVTLLATGTCHGADGLEDYTCAEYISALLTDNSAAADKFVARVPESSWGKLFGDPHHPHFPRRDLELAMMADKFDFALAAKMEGTSQILRRA